MSNVTFPIECQSCGATGEVLRVTANLQCRCGSTDLDLWDGVTKTAADDPDDFKDSEWWAKTHPDEDDESASGSREFLKREKKESAAHGPGTGWGQSRPDPAANWSDYVGPPANANPNITRKNDADDSHTCTVCNGTGQDPRASGGGYEENVCRNCHGTGKVVYPTENDTPSLDAHMPKGSPLGAGSNGHYSSKKGEVRISVAGGGGGASYYGGGGATTIKVADRQDDRAAAYHQWAKDNGHNPDDLDTLKRYEKQPGISRAHANDIADVYHGEDDTWRQKRASKVAVPGVSGTKIVTARQGDKIMAMAATIIEHNSGLTSLEAFELARRAVTAFPEDGDQ